MCLVQEPRLMLLDEPTAGMARADTENTMRCSKDIRHEAAVTMAIIPNTTMQVVFSLGDRITVLAQGTRLSKAAADPIKTEFPRCAKLFGAKRRSNQIFKQNLASAKEHDNDRTI